MRARARSDSRGDIEFPGPFLFITFHLIRQFGDIRCLRFDRFHNPAKFLTICTGPSTRALRATCL